ncbi:MAG: dephospho-CoA kinase [Clostridiales bacterium]|jgi:dephospho-CoA kinase|nr:dephospho-CoA kinase [Clostridiales bacterium]
MVLGVTGGSGSGKSDFCACLAEICGAHIINADFVYHSQLARNEEMRGEIMQEFGTLDHVELAEAIFSDAEKRAKLNKITHKYIIEAIDELVALYKGNSAITVIDAPLLIESGYQVKCDCIVAVLSGSEKRIVRIMQRDRLTRKQAENRVNSQNSNDFYRQRADFVIENDGSTENLRAEGERLLKRLNIQYLQ